MSRESPGNGGKPSPPTPPRPSVTVFHDYHSAVNEIVEPDKYVSCSRYFVRRWMPLLGGVATQVVLALRSLGYHNVKTGEKRDGIEIEFPELAELVGVSVPTLKRLLHADEATGVLTNDVLARFVTKDRQYWRDPVTNRVLRSANVYRVKMDDPLHEDDEARLNEILRSREKPGGTPVRGVKSSVNPDGRPSGYQNDTQVRPSSKDQNDTQMPSKYHFDSPGDQSESFPNQIDPQESQNDTTLKDYSETHRDTLTTPAAPGDSLSLFSGEDSDGAEVDGRVSDGSAGGVGDEGPGPGGVRLPERPKQVVTLKEVEADWQAMPQAGRDRYRAEAVRRLLEAGHPSPKETQIEPTMFKLYWVERKGLRPSEGVGT
jgi:hypothetical protein